MRILLLDIHSQSSKAFRSALTTIGATYEHINSPEEVLKTAVNYNPDLIIVEARGVDEKLLEVVKDLKKTLQLSDTPIIFLSAETSAESTLEGLHVGCVEYIHQPVDLNNLVKTLMGYNCINSIKRLAGSLKIGLDNIEAKYAENSSEL